MAEVQQQHQVVVVVGSTRAQNALTRGFAHGWQRRRHKWENEAGHILG